MTPGDPRDTCHCVFEGRPAVWDRHPKFAVQDTLAQVGSLAPGSIIGFGCFILPGDFPDSSG